MDGQTFFNQIITLFLSYWLYGLGLGLAIRVLLMAVKS